MAGRLRHVNEKREAKSERALPRLSPTHLLPQQHTPLPGTALLLPIVAPLPALQPQHQLQQVAHGAQHRQRRPLAALAAALTILSQSGQGQQL